MLSREQAEQKAREIVGRCQAPGWRTPCQECSVCRQANAITAALLDAAQAAPSGEPHDLQAMKNRVAEAILKWFGANAPDHPEGGYTFKAVADCSNAACAVLVATPAHSMEPVVWMVTCAKTNHAGPGMLCRQRDAAEELLTPCERNDWCHAEHRLVPLYAAPPTPSGEPATVAALLDQTMERVAQYDAATRGEPPSVNDCPCGRRDPHFKSVCYRPPSGSA